MKIKEITVDIFSWPGLDDVIEPAHDRAISGANLGLVTVTTESGIVGNAFLGSSVFPADLDAKSLVDILKPALVGRNALDRELLYSEMIRWGRRRMTTLRAIGALDIALWDIGGKAAGLPVHRLIGTYRTSIPAYASSMVLADIDTYSAEVAMYRDMGWKGYKIHPPQNGPAYDIALCAAVRKAAGDNFPLMIDSMWQYTYGEAIRVGRALEELGYLWFEDPLAENDIYHYSLLCAKLDIPVMATEYPECTLDAHAKWIDARATDMLRGDVAVKGGITPMIKLARLAEAYHLPLEIHHGANSHNNAANLHVGAVSPACGYYEVMLPDRTNKFGLAEEITVGSDGCVRVPEEPGIGAKIDFEAVDRLTMARLK